MPVTEFGTNDPQTVKLWSKMLTHEAISQTYINRFMGTSENAIIQRKTDLSQARGDTVKFDLLMQMTGYGVTGDNPLKGFEEALVYHQDELKVDQRRIAHGFRTMSQQLTVHELRRDGRKNLADRYATIMDEFMFAYLAGTAGDNASLAAALPHAGNALQTPDAGHLLDKNSETFRTDHIEILVEMAQTVQPLMRPPTVDGEAVYILVVHPFCLTDLRNNSDNTLWRDLVSNAAQRGGDNPLFRYAKLRWADVLIHVTPRIPITNGVAHNVFLGAQAGCLGFGNAYSRLDQQTYGSSNLFSWFEQKEDYGNEKGVGAGSIFGMKKTRFNSTDFGVIRLDTVGAAHS